MIPFILKRLLSVILLLWAMSVLVFAITRILPGNVAYVILGEYATEPQLRALEQVLGLNDPLWEQYARWAGGLVHGDLGRSIVMQRPAGPLILEALGRSAVLAGIALVLVAVIGIALGVHSAT